MRSIKYVLLFFLVGPFQGLSTAFAQSTTVAPSQIGFQISTDLACYKPGSKVVFRVVNVLPAGSYVKYLHLNNVVAQQKVNGKTWQWVMPAKDYSGYLAALYYKKNEKETLLSTIGVDVSSNWAKFPRYGFLSKYHKLDYAETQKVVAALNRYHINGLQFYDWQSKHHEPLAGSLAKPDTLWKDIANRPIYYQTVRNYITAAHSRNMKAMFYNLVYGALKDAGDKVDDKWYMYDDQKHQVKEKFALPDYFWSDIFFTNPANSGWQHYLTHENKKVYQVFPFDGYHMDQVGNRDKTLYDYNGNTVELDKTFGQFVKGIKALEPSRPVVINAVNQYGQQGIGQSPVEFMYSEVWPPNTDFAALAKVITDNNTWSAHKKASVLAAYMNYDMAEHKGYFNTPAILLADAVIFAFGGSHLELGEHMLCKEYFPNSNLQMKEDLKTALVPYYDFLIAYENILRGNGSFHKIQVSSVSQNLTVNNWKPKRGEVSVVTKTLPNCEVVHLINLTDASTLEWRDNKGIQTEPKTRYNVKLTITVNNPVKRVWMASPDFNSSAPRTLNFQQTSKKITITLPDLKYWDMVVVEYQYINYQ
jgi:dextranase